jgi:4'-phosphopantetheinyl transferase
MSPTDDPSWELPPLDLEIHSDSVHVWRAMLDHPGTVARRLGRILSPDEQRRAERFRSESDRGRFIVGRGSLRRILSRYLEVAPEELVLRYGAQGKPMLAESRGDLPLQFNLSHSQGLALLAIARGRPVGIDIEQIRPVVDAEQIVARFFSAPERAEFAQLPDGQRLEAFFRGWTRKEAYLKATGAGLSLPLDQFAVSLSPGEPPRLVDVAERPLEAGRWTLLDLAPGPGYLGAVAVKGPVGRLKGFRHDPAGSD